MKRVKHFLILCICFSLFLTSSVNASSVNSFFIKNGDDVSIEETVNGSLISFGNNVNSNNTVNGINMLFGNNVNYKGISEYALLVGNNVNVFGTIKNDGFILGNLVTFDMNVVAERDLFVFGNSVTLNGTINRDITIYASEVTINDSLVLGNLTVNATTLNISSQAVVNGQLSYNEDIEANIESEAIGEIKLLEKIVEEITFQDKAIQFIVDYCGILVLFVALAFVLPKMFKKIEDNNQNPSFVHLLSLIGYGALSIIVVPILFAVLLSFIIGLPLALLLIAVYIIVICLANIFSGYLYGYLIWKYLIKKENNTLLIGLIGITLCLILNIIPFIGGLLSFVNLTIGIGVFLQLFKNNKN